MTKDRERGYAQLGSDSIPGSTLSAPEIPGSENLMVWMWPRPGEALKSKANDRMAYKLLSES
jgi:hypothetical protein